MFEFLKKAELDPAPLEFGPIKGRDRIQIAATLKVMGQGTPMTTPILPTDILESGETSLDGDVVCRHVFGVIKSLFDSPAVRPLMQQAQLVGTMSDELDVRHVNEYVCTHLMCSNLHLIRSRGGIRRATRGQGRKPLCETLRE